MNTIIHYILRGKGYGLKFLTLFSLIMALAMGLMTYNVMHGYLSGPEMQNFISEMPTLEIKNKKLIAPPDAYVKLAYPQMLNTFFVVNTSDTDLDLMHFDTAFYFTPDRVYLKMGDNIQASEYDADMTITPDFIKTVLKTGIVLIPIFFALFLSIFIWLGYGILYLAAKFFAFLIKKPIAADMRGRIVLLAWLCIMSLNFIFSFFGFAFSLSAALFWAFFLIALIFLKISDLNPTQKNGENN